MYAKILIVENNDDFREIVKNHLKTKNPDFEILEAVSAESAIKEALDKRPRIILMDMRLPNVSGVETAKVIKDSFAECFIVILTMLDTGEFQKFYGNGFISAFVNKIEIYDKLFPLLQKFLTRI